MITRQCVVLGISHDLQRGIPCCSVAELRRFEILLTSLNTQYGFKCVIEEFSVDALVEAKIGATSIQFFSKRIGANHFFCDPTIKERAKLGIQSETTLRASREFSTGAATPIEQLILDATEKREAHWLEVINEQAKFPLLFVCGENHVDGFSEKLPRLNIHVSQTVIFD